MNQISKELYKDPTIEAIMSKRPAYIENAYNKNLNARKRSLMSSSPDTAASSSHNIQQQVMNNHELTLFSEKTDVTDLMSVLNEFEKNEQSEDDDDDKELNNDGGASKYKEYCYDLKIGPSSTVLKCLLTSSLCLSNYGLSSTGLLALATALKENLCITKLDLSGNEIGVSGVKHLANLFEDNTNITELNISRNFIGSKAIKHLTDMFKRNPLLRHVDLSHNDLNDEDGVILVEALEDHLVTHLNLSHNKFGEKSGLIMGKWIGENGYLQDLDLSWNHIRKGAALAVAKGVSDNNKMLKINLSWNGFGNEGAVALGKALAHNVMLEELDMRSNRIGPQGFVALFSCFKENNTLKKISIGRNNVNNESLEIVLKLFKSLNPLSLLSLDVSNITLKPNIDEHIENVREVHPNFKCIHGFLNFEERKPKNLMFDQSILLLEEHCEKNNVILTELFSNLYGNDITTITYDEFKDGLNKSGFHLKPPQQETLIAHMDKGQMGSIDFSDLVLFDEQIKKSRKKRSNAE